MLDILIEQIAFLIGYVGVAVVIFGSVMTIIKFFVFLGGGLSDKESKKLRHLFMIYLSIGLDFMIAKDIILTLSLETGDYSRIIQLVVIILIRIVLSFFVHLEEGTFHLRKKKS